MNNAFVILNLVKDLSYDLIRSFISLALIQDDSPNMKEKI
jgi:hypothetical protein